MKVKQGHAESFNKNSEGVGHSRPWGLDGEQTDTPCPRERDQGTGKTQVNMLDCSDGRTGAS